MKKQESLNLSRLIYVYLKSLILKPFEKKAITKLPQKVGKYELISSLKKIGTIKPFKLGIYKDAFGNKAVAKFWYGKYKDFNYYALNNELVLYQILTRVIKRLGNNIPAEYKNIKLPKIVLKNESKNQRVILVEYVDGDVSVGLTSQQKIKLYFKVVDFLNYLGTRLTQNERRSISKRNAKNYILLYPFLLVKALLTHPRATLPLLKGIPIFIKSIPILLTEDTNPLVHRDLHFRNILVNGKKIYLIDLQLCALTLKLHENITTLRYLWKEGDFYKYLLKEIDKRYSKNENFKKLFRGLAVNSGTHGLTGSEFTKGKIDLFIDFLNFGINFK